MIFKTHHEKYFIADASNLVRWRCLIANKFFEYIQTRRTKCRDVNIMVNLVDDLQIFSGTHHYDVKQMNEWPEHTLILSMTAKNK